MVSVLVAIGVNALWMETDVEFCWFRQSSDITFCMLAMICCNAEISDDAVGWKGGGSDIGAGFCTLVWIGVGVSSKSVVKGGWDMSVLLVV